MVLHPWQVWDPQRLCFFVGLDATKQRHRGHVVYKDKFDRRLVILEASA